MKLEQAKELYPKFYKYPANYLGVEVGIKYTNGLKGIFKEIEIKDGEVFYGVHLPSGQVQLHDIEQLIPKFKPQEGEAFIKDLEEAVNSMWFSPNIFQYQGEALGEYEFKRGNISIWVGVEDFRIRTNSYGISIDAAAYVDEMRKRGYYL